MSGGLGTRYSKPGRFSHLKEENWCEEAKAKHSYQLASKQPGETESAESLGHPKFKTLYRVVKGLTDRQGEDVIRSVLGSQFAQPFDLTALDVRMVNRKTYRAAFQPGLSHLQNFAELDAYTQAELEHLGLAGLHAAWMVRGDRDCHALNIGYEKNLVTGKIEKLVSFDFDWCGEYQTEFVPKEIEVPGYIKPPVDWEMEKPIHRPYYHFLRRPLRFGGALYSVDFLLFYRGKESSCRSLTRRAFETSLKELEITRLPEYAFLKNLAESSIARRQQFEQFVFNACLPNLWFEYIAKAYITPDANWVFVNAMVEHHQVHMQRLKDYLLRSEIFREDFKINFEIYLYQFKCLIKRYNERYKLENCFNALRIDLDEAIKNLYALKKEAAEFFETRCLELLNRPKLNLVGLAVLALNEIERVLYEDVEVFNEIAFKLFVRSKISTIAHALNQQVKINKDRRLVQLLDVSSFGARDHLVPKFLDLIRAWNISCKNLKKSHLFFEESKRLGDALSVLNGDYLQFLSIWIKAWSGVSGYEIEWGISEVNVDGIVENLKWLKTEQMIWGKNHSKPSTSSHGFAFFPPAGGAGALLPSSDDESVFGKCHGLK